jgi:UDP-N-acetyl-2-amino-2-deoxyglucuronate dehydrogenase
MPAPLNFALVGAAGFVAPRHLEAITATGNRLVAALDPHDSVGVLDAWAPQALFFTEQERFDRHLEKLRQGPEEERIHFVSICSPNYLHDAHARLALRLQADAICEKPLVINPWNLDQLARLEEEHGRRVYTVLQLRHHPALRALRERKAGRTERAEVVLTYLTQRGPWYQVSWKGDPAKSGGLAMNLGVHFFDFLIWMFGPVERAEVHLADATRMAGSLELERARVRWFLSVAAEDVPADVRARGGRAYRALKVDGESVELSQGFEGLHRAVYEAVLCGEGLGIEAVRPSIELIHTLRHAAVTSPGPDARHPLLEG